MINDSNINEKRPLFLRILRENMYVATGCTEPGAISFCAAIAARELKKLNDETVSIDVYASKNILKNAMAAGLPNTKHVGVNFAAVIGAVFGNPDNKLNVNNDIKTDDYKIAEEMIGKGLVTVSLTKEPNLLYIEVVIKGKNHKASAVITDAHDNISKIIVDDKVILEKKANSGDSKEEKLSAKEIQEILSIKEIFDFVDKYLDVKNDDIEILKKAEKINLNISKEGLENQFGLEIGKNIKELIDNGEVANSMKARAVMRATAAADARMAGAPYPVVANSGSGNQGITINVPVLSYAEDLKVSEEKKYKALALANLVSIYIKSKFGTLSAFCGATIASIGAGCGIVYLLDGGYEEVSTVIINMIGTLTGVMCDGAKPDCSLKIYSGLETAFLTAQMALKGKRVSKDEGIVCENVESTINNIARVSTDCSSNVDDNILDMMLHK